MYDKEDIYDEQIAPLMTKIIEICKEENIPMTAQFALKSHREDDNSQEDPMHCTTILPAIEEKHGEEIQNWNQFIAEQMKYGPNGKPFVMTSVIKSG